MVPDTRLERATVGAQPGTGLRARPWLGTVCCLALVLSACAGQPLTVPIPPAGAHAARQDLEVWQGARATTLHGVVVTSDSLSGVPVRQPPSCDSCRIPIPLAAIDSVREVSIDRAALGTMGLVAGFAALTLLAWHASAGD